MIKSNCLFCYRESDNSQFPNNFDRIFQCPSCGKYGISEELIDELDIKTPDEKVKISHLLAKYRLRNRIPIYLSVTRGAEVKNFNRTTFKDFLATYPKETTEIIDRTLLNLSRLIPHPSKPIRISENIKEFFFSQDGGGILYIIRQLANQEFTTLTTSMPNDIQIEAEGWKRINELKHRPEGLRNQVFVAMWFDKSLDDIYFKGIKMAIEETTKYKAMRVDLVHHNNKICDQIIAEINKSIFMVADFTGDRGGVYFEAGYAQGLKIPVIWTVQEDWVDKLHFDTRQYNHIVYKDENELYSKLKARIEATILNDL